MENEINNIEKREAMKHLTTDEKLKAIKKYCTGFEECFDCKLKFFKHCTDTIHKEQIDLMYRIITEMDY